MLPAIYNPTIKQGVPFRRHVTITDDAGTPLDLTGATIIGQIRNTDGTKAADFSFELNNPIDGELIWLLDDTGSVPATNGIHQLPYDIFIIMLAGNTICPFEGLFAVEAAQTELV